MTCTLEKVLADAKSLVERLRDHDGAAEILIEQTTLLNKRVEAMKQVSEYVHNLSDGDLSCFTHVPCSFSTRKRLRC